MDSQNMPQDYTNRIFNHLSQRNYRPQRIVDIANDLGIPIDDRQALIAAAEQLIEEGKIVVGAGHKVTLPPPKGTVTGKLHLTAKGFGFLSPDKPVSDGDLFVPDSHIGNALHGDRVRAAVMHSSRRGRSNGRSPYTARVVEVIERADTRLVGELIDRRGTFFVDADGKGKSLRVIIRDPGAKDAKAGDKVVVEITEYPDASMNALAEGVITEVLGDPGKPDVETEAICRIFDLPGPFPEAALNDARHMVQSYEGEERESFFDGREDLRDQFTLTIDPPDARDFDDAISISKLPDGGWELGVHIADVSAFVRRDSPLDKEAYERGNSVYLPRRVIPMLPEILSNGICSLQPEVERLTKSAFIKYDEDGEVISWRLSNSVIKSDFRLTYLEAQALIDDDPEEARTQSKTTKPYTDQLLTTLKALNDAAKAIHDRRRRAGTITLDLPEVELIFDDDGHVIDAEPEDDAYTHKLIEMFMVEANEAVARTFVDLNVPLIRRVHPDPAKSDTGELQALAKQVAGFVIPERPTRKELQHLLEATHGKPAAKGVHIAVLRTLTKAEYDPTIIGHYALASEHYTHFTSPIRRYPDLCVHRTIDLLFKHAGAKPQISKDPKKRGKLGNTLRSDKQGYDFESLVELGGHCSRTERNAESAERELRDLLVLQLMATQVGSVFDGTVTNTTSFGAFVQIDKYLVEGLIKTAELPGGKFQNWRLDDYTGSLRAERSGYRITMGDPCRIKIVHVDLAKRTMDLMLVNEEGEPLQPKALPNRGDSYVPSDSHKSKEKKHKKDRGKGKGNKRRSGSRGRH